MRKNRRELGSKKRRRNEGEDLRDEEESCGNSWPWEKMLITAQQKRNVVMVLGALSATDVNQGVYAAMQLLYQVKFGITCLLNKALLCYLFYSMQNKEGRGKID